MQQDSKFNGSVVRLLLSFAALACLDAASPMAAQTNLYVAADGSAQFKSVQAAIMFVPAGSPDNPVLIHIKPGTYKELLYVQREKRFFHLVGDGGDASKVILTYDLNANIKDKDGKSIGTFRTPSTTIDAEDFTAENVTFENSAGPVGQALAIRVDGDRAVFRNCRFLGWQDTIFVNRGRQYFEDCYIEGHVDFIFGGATCYFERCHLEALRNGFLTAASTPPEQPYGYVFSHCKITGKSREIRTFLGRPWRKYAAVTFLNTEMSDVVKPAGWNNWGRAENEKTARYAEYNSTGPGADIKDRVPWARQLTKTEAETLTARKVLSGTDGWDPLRTRGD